MTRESISGSVLILALSCFAAGVAVGLAVPAVTAAFAGVTDPDAEYVDQLRHRYDLTREQARRIRMVQSAQEREHLAIIKDVSGLPKEIREKVVQVNWLAEERLKYVLTPEQRRRFLRDSALDGDPSGEDRESDEASGKE